VKIVIFPTVRAGKAPEAGMSKGQTKPEKKQKKEIKIKGKEACKMLKGRSMEKKAMAKPISERVHNIYSY